MHLCSGAPPSAAGTPPSASDPREVERRRKQRLKNRAAAQRSRQKQTDKADELHQQHEWLEKDNQALRKEIWSLRAEVKLWLRTLEEHQCVCPVPGVPSSRQAHSDGWSETEPAPPDPLAEEHAPPMKTLPTPLQTPASSSSTMQALFSAPSLSISLTPLLVTPPPAGSPPMATLTQTHGVSGLPASSSGLCPEQPACLLSFRAKNLREGKTEEPTGGCSSIPHPEHLFPCSQNEQTVSSLDPAPHSLWTCSVFSFPNMSC